MFAFKFQKIKLNMNPGSGPTHNALVNCSFRQGVDKAELYLPVNYR